MGSLLNNENVRVRSFSILFASPGSILYWFAVESLKLAYNMETHYCCVVSFMFQVTQILLQ